MSRTPEIPMTNLPCGVDLALAETLPGGVAGFRSGDLGVLFSTPGLAKLAGYEPDDPALNDPAWFCRRIHPEDREALGERTARQIAERGRSELVYRLLRRDGTTVWAKQYAGPAADGERGSYLLCLILDHTEVSRARQTARRAAGQMNRLVDAIPGGVARVVLDRELRVVLASEGFYRMTGYSREAFHAPPLDGRGDRLLLPEDLPAVRRTVQKLAQAPRASVAVEYRFRRKDGAVVWVTAYASGAVEDSGRKTVDVVFIDTTNMHRLKLERHLASERYRIIAEECQDIVFELDLETGMVVHSAQAEEKLGYPLPEQSMERLLRSGIYHPDDLPAVRALAASVSSGEDRAEAEYRLLRADGTPVWFRFRGTVIRDCKGKPIRAVGVLNDIDRYKRENAQLERKARTDLLTGLLNRVSLQEQVERALAGGAPLGCHAFCLIDLDDFKDVNDTAGHDVGDAVLSAMGRRIRTQFREEDAVGRMGGDEFAVFLTNLPSVDVVRDRAERLGEIFRDGFLTQEGERTVTGSIGISLCPDHGHTFADLYRRADRALYAAKRAGRNRWAIYDPVE